MRTKIELEIAITDMDPSIVKWQTDNSLGKVTEPSFEMRIENWHDTQSVL